MESVEVPLHPDGATLEGTDREMAVRVEHLEVGFNGQHGRVMAVRDVTFEIAQGQALALVGESGSGKSTVARSLLGLHPRGTHVSGKIEVDGVSIVGANPRTLRSIRGNRVSMVFQDPMSSLNPVRRIDDQIIESLRIHQQLTRNQARARAIQLLADVGIRDAAAKASSFPHEFSGGMRQRVVIAMAMANEPALIVADEPTTALDVTVQAQVLRVLAEQRADKNAAMLLVTHDLEVAAINTDQIAVMYAGKIVEFGPTAAVFERPLMPYTMGLLAAIPDINSPVRELETIPGTPVSPTQLGTGCAFAPRCRFATDLCVNEDPQLRQVDGQAPRSVACHHFESIASGPTTLASRRPTSLDSHAALDRPKSSPALQLVSVTVDYRSRKARRSRVGRPAVRDVSLEVLPGEVFGLVGESGCGKSTLSRAIVGLTPRSSGEILIAGTNLSELRGRERQAAQSKVQMVFQDPKSSLDPTMTVRQIVEEPLVIAGDDKKARGNAVARALIEMELPAELASRYPHQLSGGQQQRVAIARALVSSPDLLVLDEPVSSLDVSVQASVVNLLAHTARRTGVAQVFIAHDLAVVAHISDRIAVMHRGEIVEAGTSEEVIRRPRHPYTRELLQAIPRWRRAD